MHCRCTGSDFPYFHVNKISALSHPIILRFESDHGRQAFAQRHDGRGESGSLRSVINRGDHGKRDVRCSEEFDTSLPLLCCDEITRPNWCDSVPSKKASPAYGG